MSATACVRCVGGLPGREAPLCPDCAKMVAAGTTSVLAMCESCGGGRIRNRRTGQVSEMHRSSCEFLVHGKVGVGT